MNVSQYISNKIDGGADSGSFTSSVTKIAIISIAMGLAVMVVSFAILEGFRNEIQSKIFSFGSHLQISKYDTNNSLEVEPIGEPQLIQELKRNPQVKSFQPFARKTAIIKTKDEVLGVVLKGIDEKNGQSLMRKNLVEGKFLSFPDSSASNDVLVSRKVADKLRLKPGDNAQFYFIQNPPRVRRFTVRGIYQTGLDEFDEVYVIGDIRQVRDLAGWPDSLVGGMEVTLKDFRRLDIVADNLYENLRYDLKLDKITEQYAQLFDWLQLLNRNVVIFLLLIIFVATFNMVATIFIMILERTNMIGVLKAIGATDNQIRSMFFFRGLSLTMRGMLYGNIVGLGFCAIQYFFHPIPLDPENYYMDRVPIHWDLFIILVLNAATFLTSLLAVLIPTYLIARIKPVTAIKFD
ncbi:ABC transporter permease [Hymenobacter mucosus]|uniref:Lipoprotein-releasing system permease protein n=1 Tax=Hymenobacter mucosus TaxID=1411120 RepID=A0A238XSQ4_9BACT|nr:FtsX-like permease family protein [Hymenobacter mucosus]SNR61483.1 lipoprotein-releasing system permease protein [Hymenobacter mucosus]